MYVCFCDCEQRTFKYDLRFVLKFVVLVQPMDIIHCVVVLIIARSLSYHLCEDFKEERGRS